MDSLTPPFYFILIEPYVFQLNPLYYFVHTGTILIDRYFVELSLVYNNAIIDSAFERIE